MKARIERIVVEQLTDDDPDLSFLGTYTDRAEPFAIDREERGHRERGTFRYFVPANPEYAQQDYERFESYNRGAWRMCGVRARAGVILGGVYQTLSSGGLWGIEDDDTKDSRAHRTGVGAEELASLAEILREAGFSARAVKIAIKSAERKENR